MKLPLPFVFLLLSAMPLMAKEIADTAEEVNPLLIGQQAPDVMVWTGDGTPKRLNSVLATKPTVLIFYRGGWCPYCNAQLRDLNGIEAKLESLGYQLIALSPDLPDALNEMTKTRALNYQLLSDFRLEVSKAFGLAFRVDPAYAAMAASKVNAKMQKYAGETQFTLPVPAVYIFDQAGRVQFQYVNPNYAVRLHPELLLKAAELAQKAKN